MKNDLNREEIGLKTSILDLIVTMSEGNPGAIRLLTELLNSSSTGFMSILSLDDMNIRGTQIWIGYKDYCGQNLNRFIEAISNREQGMIDCINKCGEQGNHQHKATRGGASFNSNRGFLDEDKITGRYW